jgi:fumarylacetoacetase
MNDGTERKFINDNDTVIMKGYCENSQVSIGFEKFLLNYYLRKKVV